MEGMAEARRESTVKDFLEVIFRRKWVIVGIVAVATCLTIIMTLRQPALYESIAKVLVRRGETPGVYDAGIRTLTWEEEIASQIEMIKSEAVVVRARELLPRFMPEGVRPTQRIQLARVNAGVISTSNVVWVTYNSGDATFCRAAVDAIVNAYQEYYSGIRTPPAMEDFFSQEIQRLKQEVEYWRERKEEILREWDIVDIEDQRRYLIGRYSSYESDLGQVRLDRINKEAAIANLERLRAGGIEDIAAVSSGLTDSQIEETAARELRIRLQELLVHESEMATKYTERNPEMQRLRKQIEDIRAMISQEIDTQILINRTQLAVLMQREKTLRDILGELGEEMAAYPRKEVELERVEAMVQKLQRSYNDVLDQHMAAKIKVASNPEWTVTILNPASEVYRKKTRDYVRMALGPLFSIIVALGLAFFVDNLDHSIKSIAEAEENLGLSVLANFPETNRK